MREPFEAFKASGNALMMLGIDPGLANTGWSVVCPVSAGRYEIVSCGTILTSKKDSLGKRLAAISDGLVDIAARYGIRHASYEDIFFTNNISSAISVAKVIGSFHYAFAKASISLDFFTPTQIKLCVTGEGNADKSAVRNMIMRQVVCNKEPKTDHETDSIACAITCIEALKREIILAEI